MLLSNEWPLNDKCRAAKTFRDITNRDPVPIGEAVEIVDYDSCGDGDGGLWLVEWRGMLYWASPDELKL